MRKLLAFHISLILFGVVLCSTTMPLYEAFAADMSQDCHQGNTDESTSCHAIVPLSSDTSAVRISLEDPVVPVDLPQFFVENTFEASTYQRDGQNLAVPHLRSKQTVVLRI